MTIRPLLLLTTTLIALSACSRAPATVAVSQPEATTASSNFQTLPRLTVHKTASCGCCHLWVEHLQQAGLSVAVIDHDDLSAVKQRLSIPAPLASCHTAEVDGYVIEGHVPASDIQRLLKERPVIRGLVVPGMPMGSPGMEMPDGSGEAYAVLALHDDGHVSEFARHGP